MNIGPIVEHGWKFELSGSHLILTSEENQQTQVQINAQAAYSLLNYLYQYRDDLHDEAGRLEDEEVEQQRKEHSMSEQSDRGETMS